MLKVHTLVMFHTALCIPACTLFGMRLRDQRVPRLQGVAEEGHSLGVVRSRGRSRSWFWRACNVLTLETSTYLKIKKESSHH